MWARGEYGGEKVKFGVGIIESGEAYPDSARVTTDTIELGSEWQRYTIPLTGEDLSAIRTGFVVTFQGRRSPVTIYLDDIRFTE